MERISNPKLKNLLLEAVREEYSADKPLPHLTELIYCLTRSYYDRTRPLVPNGKELLMYAVGFAAERVFISQRRVNPSIFSGIHYSPDFVQLGGILGELKTTRASKKFHDNNLPETWIEQIKFYAYASKMLEYDLAIIYIIPADIRAERLVFTQEELEANYQYLLERRDIYMEHLKEGSLPIPYKFCKGWECRDCRYNLRCGEISRRTDAIPNTRTS